MRALDMKIIIILLTTILITSNIYWAYNYPDTETTAMKHDSELWERDESIMYLLELLPKVSRNIKKSDFISISKKLTNKEFVKKNECYWLVNIGYKFDIKGNLIKASHKLYDFQDNECNF